MTKEPSLCHIFYSEAGFLQQFHLDVIQLLRKVYVDLMRIHQTHGFFPQRLFFLLADVADLHDRRRFVAAEAVLEDRDQKLADRVSPSLDPGLFPGLDRIEDDHILVLVKRLANEADQVRADLSGLLVVNTVNRFIPGICDLFNVLRTFDLRRKFGSIGLFDRRHLIDAAESRAVARCNEVRSDTP